MAIESMRADGIIKVQERVVTMDEVRTADEVWITNSSKHIAPVVELDGQPVGDGLVGPVWEKAMTPMRQLSTISRVINYLTLTMRFMDGRSAIDGS